MAAGRSISDTRILVIEDDPQTLSYITQVLSVAYGHPLSAINAEDGLRLVKTQPVRVVFTDVYLPGMSGLDFLKAVKDFDSRSEIVLFTGQADVKQAVGAVKAGAYNYLQKPINKSTLLATAKRVMEKVNLVSENLRLRSELRGTYGKNRLIGSSAPMREVYEKIDIVKDVNSNVLIQGETGTGKELVARYIHYCSARAEESFVKLNCGAIPKDLLESELFGHEKGSFTGAVNQRIGRFEMAHHGSILLDEIGDMPLELQIKLLAVIQDRVVERIGGAKTIPVDVRIIAATHQDLGKAIKEKRFREDLFYRLNVINIHLPPLRERKEDIPLLVEYFLLQLQKRTGKKVTSVDSQAMRALMTYDYPGNVRELENIIERAVVLCRNSTIMASDLPELISGTNLKSNGNRISLTPGMALEDVEQICILETLKMVGGNKRKAAQLLKISEKSIYNKLQRYGVTLGAKN